MTRFVRVKSEESLGYDQLKNLNLNKLNILISNLVFFKTNTYIMRSNSVNFIFFTVHIKMCSRNVSFYENSFLNLHLQQFARKVYFFYILQC